MSNESPATSSQIDKCCDLFESHWQGEKAFSIEDVLAKVPEAQKTVYLKPLLAVEIELRSRAGDIPTDEELCRRFPNFESAVREVLASPQVKDSLSGSKTIAPRHGHRSESVVSTAKGLQIPRKLGRYRIIRKLGQGAMGAVFLAEDGELKRKVALKIPHSSVQRDPSARQRFAREAQAAASIQHPGICPVFDVGDYHGLQYICMGYVEGFPLTRFAVAESGLSEIRIAQIILKLADALEVAHSAGVIHRDIKPANIMINDRNEPIIMDFGLALRMQEQSDARLTRSGETIGSPAYMSPEQVEAATDVSAVSDVYSLGIVLYELLTGRIPFEGSVASVMGQILTKVPEKPSEYRPDLSVRLEKICLQIIKKEPNERFPSMAAVSNALTEYIEKYSSVESPTKATAANDADVRKTLRGQQRREAIESAISSGDYDKAEMLLRRLAGEKSPEFATEAKWGAKRLKELQQDIDKIKKGRKQIYNTALGLMESYDYEQVVVLLKEYPLGLRTTAMHELLVEAETRTAEVATLRTDIRTARRQGNEKLLLAACDRLLELKPNDGRTLELWDRLTSLSAGPISKVLGHRQPSLIQHMSAGTQWIVVASAVALICFVPIYQWTVNYLNGPKGKDTGNVVSNGWDMLLNGSSEKANTDTGDSTDALSSGAPADTAESDPDTTIAGSSSAGDTQNQAGSGQPGTEPRTANTRSSPPTYPLKERVTIEITSDHPFSQNDLLARIRKKLSFGGHNSTQSGRKATITIGYSGIVKDVADVIDFAKVVEQDDSERTIRIVIDEPIEPVDTPGPEPEQIADLIRQLNNDGRRTGGAGSAFQSRLRANSGTSRSARTALIKLQKATVEEQYRKDVLEAVRPYMAGTFPNVGEANKVVARWAERDDWEIIDLALRSKVSPGKSEVYAKVVTFNDSERYPDMVRLISSNYIGKQVRESLIEIGPPIEQAVIDEVTAIAKVVKGSGFVVRDLVEVLGEIGTDKSVPPLESLTRHNIPVIANAARQSLEKIQKR